MREDRDLHFARRLVAFGDIVFGFGLSQLALQLTRPRVPGDVLRNSREFVAFLITFATIAMFWIVFHRANENVKKVTTATFAAAFVALAAVAFLPFVMDLFLRFSFSAIAAGGYALSFGTFFIVNAIILRAGAAQSAAELNESERLTQLERFWRWLVVGLLFLGSLGIMWLDPGKGVVSWSLIYVAALAVRWRFRRARAALAASQHSLP